MHVDEYTTKNLCCVSMHLLHDLIFCFLNRPQLFFFTYQNINHLYQLYRLINLHQWENVYIIKTSYSSFHKINKCCISVTISRRNKLFIDQSFYSKMKHFCLIFVYLTDFLINLIKAYLSQYRTYKICIDLLNDLT